MTDIIRCQTCDQETVFSGAALNDGRLIFSCGLGHLTASNKFLTGSSHPSGVAQGAIGCGDGMAAVRTIHAMDGAADMDAKFLMDHIDSVGREQWPEIINSFRRQIIAVAVETAAVPPSPVAVEHAAIIDRITNITTWLREPDSIEEASLEWLMDWMDRRPIAELAMVAMLMPGPVVSSTQERAP